MSSNILPPYDDGYVRYNPWQRETLINKYFELMKYSMEKGNGICEDICRHGYQTYRVIEDKSTTLEARAAEFKDIESNIHAKADMAKDVVDA